MSDLGTSAFAEPSIDDWVSRDALESVVGPKVDVRLLAHNPLNAVTGGIWRVSGSSSSVIVKVVTDGRAHEGPDWWAASRADRHWNSWRREVLAYRDDIASLLEPDGVGAPALVALDERDDGSAVLWLEDVVGRTGPALTVDDLVALAGALGHAQGRLARDRSWDRPWLSTGFLRAYSASKPVDDSVFDDDAAWSHPRIERHLAHLRPQLVQLRSCWDALVSMAERCPQTFCHLDVWPANVVCRPDGRFALLDWAFCGAGALGEDIANLVPDSVFDLLVAADQVEDLAARAEEVYLTGVRAGGWQGDERWVRLGIRAAAVKYHWLAERLLRDPDEPTRVVYGGRTFPSDEVYAARAAGLSVLCRWSDEAFVLADELDVLRR